MGGDEAFALGMLEIQAGDYGKEVDVRRVKYGGDFFVGHGLLPFWFGVWDYIIGQGRSLGNDEAVGFGGVLDADVTDFAMNMIEVMGRNDEGGAVAGANDFAGVYVHDGLMMPGTGGLRIRVWSAVLM